jgi:hypothetical protein
VVDTTNIPDDESKDINDKHGRLPRDGCPGKLIAPAARSAATPSCSARRTGEIQSRIERAVSGMKACPPAGFFPGCTTMRASFDCRETAMPTAPPRGARSQPRVSGSLRWWGGQAADGPLVVGSKRFTESYILGEIVAQTAARHTQAQHKPGLGNTAVVLEALKAGAIDVYPEYLGTIDAEILKHPQPTDLATMRKELAAMGLGVGVPHGFQNTMRWR